MAYTSVRDSIEEIMDTYPDSSGQLYMDYQRFTNFWDARVCNSSQGDFSMITKALKNYSTSVSWPILDKADWNLVGPFTVDNHSGMQNQRIGPVSEVLGDPTDDDNLLIGTANSGIWKYISQSDEWFCVTDNLCYPGLGITSLVRNRFHPDTIYASTGSGEYPNKYGMGILESTDGGNTWSLMSSFYNGDYPFVTRLIADPLDNDTSDGLTLYALSKDAIFFSLNSGLTWAQMTGTIPANQYGYFNDISVNLHGDLIVTEANAYYNTGRVHIYDEITQVWSIVTLKDASGTALPFSHARISSYMNPNPGYHTLFLVADYIAHPSNHKRYIFMSNDPGNPGDWSLQTDISGYNGHGVSLQNQEIFFDYQTYGLILGGELMGIRDITDPQSSTITIDAGHSGINDIEMVKKVGTTGTFLVATNGGVSRVEIGLQTLFPMNTENLNGKYLPITGFVGMGVSQLGKEKIVAGSEFNETFIYENGNWQNLDSPNAEYGGDCEVAPENTETHFYQEDGNMLRVDGTSTNTLYPNTGYRVLGLKYELNKHDPNILYAGREKGSSGNGVLKVHDIQTQGSVHRETINGLADVGAIGAGDNGKLYVAKKKFAKWNTTDAVLLRSSDNGVSWTGGDLSGSSLMYYNHNLGQTVTEPLSAVIGDKVITDIEVDGSFSQNVYISISGLYSLDPYQVPINDDRRVLMSTNSGNNWTDISEGLGAVPCHALAIYETPNSNHKILFVGNEVGVFWRDLNNLGSTIWQPFIEGLPTCIVTDLDIRECTNELYISTLGRGIFKSSLDEFVDPVRTVQSGQTYTWSNGFTMFSDLIIEADAKLTIQNCTIKFTPGHKVIVKQGGQLILDNATLTNGCDTLWEGVEVWGWWNYPQAEINGSYIQGYMEMKNDAVIENARYGVRLWNPQHSNQTGGILIANDSRFHNCWQAVEAWHYENWNPNTGIPTNNATVMNNCAFIVDDLFPLSDFDCQVRLYDVWGLRFKGCEFKDQRNNITNHNLLGYGIYSLDASYEVGGLCTANPPVYPCTGANLIPSSFAGFKRAIYAKGTDGSRNVEVTQSEFERNITGIYIEAVDYLVALNNSFVVGEQDGFDIRYKGIHATASTGYRIEENDFTGIVNPDLETYGVFVHESGTDNNQVYKNTYGSLDKAEYGIGINRSARSTFMGLQFLCSDNWNTTGIDIFSDYIPGDPKESFHGIRDYQGYLTSSAANRFTPYSSEPEHSITNATVNVINYFYNNAEPLEEPVSYTPGMVILSSNGAQNSCPSNSSGGYDGRALDETLMLSAKQNLAQSESAYLNLLYNYNQLIDGGNTNAVLNEIQLSWPDDAWDLRNELLSNSPYLSEEVIREAGECGILPDAMLLEVCLANPDAVRSEELMEFLGNEIPNPMPEYMLDLIRACWDDETARTVLEATLAGYGSEMMFWSNVLISDMMQADVQQPVDTLLNYLNRRQTVSSVYSRIETHMADSNYLAAQQLLDLLPQLHRLNEAEESEYEHYDQWFDFRKDLAEEGRDLLDLSGEDLTILEGLAYNLDRTGAQVRNLLCFLYDNCIEIEINGSGSQPKSYSAKPDVETIVEKTGLEVFPNPANTYLTCRIQKEFTQGTAVVKLSDVSGRVVYRAQIESLPGDHLIDTRSFPEGTYVLHLEDASGILESTKLMIRH